jgi:hypothetical protein
MMAKAEASAASGAGAGASTGLLSKIPWWGKALGVGGAGYGAYSMLKKPEQPMQMTQPYYGP